MKIPVSHPPLLLRRSDNTPLPPSPTSHECNPSSPPFFHACVPQRSNPRILLPSRARSIQWKEKTRVESKKSKKPREDTSSLFVYYAVWPLHVTGRKKRQVLYICCRQKREEEREALSLFIVPLHLWREREGEGGGKDGTQ